VPGESDIIIALLFPSLLGTYGDGGNAVVMQRRLQWRDIPSRVHVVDVGDQVPEQCDVYLLGGAEDGAGRTAAGLLRGQNGLRRAIDAGRPTLAVCAGLQLMGHHVHAIDGGYEGLGLLDATTKPQVSRAIGEIVATPTGEWAQRSTHALTGFENHRGGTVLGPAAAPLASVARGVGNGGGLPVEGAIQGRLVATYLHGPVLARNPDLADVLLGWAVGEPLAPLPRDDVQRLRAERLAATDAPRRRGLRALLRR